MLEKGSIPDDVRGAAELALAAAKRAGTTRNRAVHDMWMRDVGEEADPKTWRMYRRHVGGLGSIAPDPPRDLASLDQDHRTLLRTRIRVLGLFWALWEVLPFYQGSRGETEQQEREREVGRWISLMEDRFVLDSDGSFVPHVADSESG